MGRIASIHHDQAPSMRQVLGAAEEKEALPSFRGASSLIQVWQICDAHNTISAFLPVADITNQSQPSLLERSNVTSNPFSTQAATTDQLALVREIKPPPVISGQV